MVEKKANPDTIDLEVEEGMRVADWGDNESLKGFACFNSLYPGFLEDDRDGGFVCNVCQQKVVDLSDWRKKAGGGRNG